MYGGGAGHFYSRLKFHNTGGSACTMRGSPEISYTGPTGHRVGHAATGTRSLRHARTVRLEPGRTAASVVEHPDPGVFPPDVCRLRRISDMLVKLRGWSAPISVAWPRKVCTGKRSEGSAAEPIQLLPKR